MIDPAVSIGTSFSSAWAVFSCASSALVPLMLLMYRIDSAQTPCAQPMSNHVKLKYLRGGSGFLILFSFQCDWSSMRNRAAVTREPAKPKGFGS
eukprot:4504259-Pleurochrysis_carterae.AAC.1